MPDEVFNALSFIEEVKKKYRIEWDEIAEITAFFNELGLTPYRLNGVEENPSVIRFKASTS